MIESTTPRRHASEVSPMTSVRDGIDHLISHPELQTGRGAYRAVCGGDVLVGSMATESGRRCRACSALVGRGPVGAADR